eukprot:Protomagalhaensia_wolfi_Nauph_80__6252@NODE_94_length_3780_cov_395_230152_g71_i0_p1_GENE_NODE_94_length_3780_cov_395_230152_g71_i0NODE_94_length_3780_cov_395_230152_g71_i0_p1_ORF_typecomplete_len335_score23_94Lactonase/PF10282_9/0_011ANAPC4_WD40/PF12894_7/0_26ANAPC4_WD40/PF12894_7/1e03Gmad1/PF10647_9/0_21_NODE_94_length_3780_cov_395_230152_g71_i05361540
MLQFLSEECFSTESVFSVGCGSSPSELLLGCALGQFSICDLSGACVLSSAQANSRAPIVWVAWWRDLLYCTYCRDGELSLWRLEARGRLQLLSRIQESAGALARPTWLSMKELVVPGRVDGTVQVIECSDRGLLPSRGITCPSAGKAFGILVSLLQLKYHDCLVCVHESQITFIASGHQAVSVLKGLETPTTATAIHNRVFVFGSNGSLAVFRYRFNAAVETISMTNIAAALHLTSDSPFKCANYAHALPDGRIIVALWDGLLAEIDPISLSIIDVSTFRMRPGQHLCTDSEQNPQCIFVCNCTVSCLGVFSFAPILESRRAGGQAYLTIPERS